MSTTGETLVLLRAFTDELARCGMTDAITSPGSRNTPILVALTSERRLRCHSLVDERSAGFFAVGLARATGRPVAITCTSGTAAAELLPAVVEAHHGQLPLIVLTADRPPELREVGAGQAIDQLRIFGTAVRWSFDVGTHEATPERVRWMRALACRAWWTALDRPPGPVHLNIALREPLLPGGPYDGEVVGGRHGARPWVVRPDDGPSDAARDELAALIAAPRTATEGGVLVAGHFTGAGRAEAEAWARACAALAEAAGLALLADPLSGARRGPAAVAHYDALLRVPAFAAAARPALVLRVGALPTSKPLRTWLAALPADTRQVALGLAARWQDPDAVVDMHLPAAPQTLEAVAERIGLAAASEPEPTPLSRWTDADRRVAMAFAVPAGLPSSPLSEPALALALGRALPTTATLFVASSMPVRDVETFFPVRDRPPRVLANRGANGIDGTIASAIGVAAASEGPLILLIGDVAVAHDAGSLLASARHPEPLVMIVIDNGGGGIFDFLPASTAPATAELYLEHVLTPPALDLRALATAARLGHRLLQTVEDLEAALDRAVNAGERVMLEVRTDREENVALHRRLWALAAEALG